MKQKRDVVVLVVEDEPLVRENAVDMIEDAGWKPIPASNPAEALRLLGEGREVDVLFTDITMPGGMDGIALAECVHQLHPEIEILVTSGKHVIANDNLPDDGTFLRKPYGFEDLVAAIGAKVGVQG